MSTNPLPKPNWNIQHQDTPCGGKLQVSTAKEYSTVNLKFVGVVIGEACQACPFHIMCTLQFDGTPAKPVAPKEEKPKGKTVVVLAFTGMAIGEFEVTAEDEAILEVTTRKGIKMAFDRASGLQMNCKNARYANRLLIPVEVPIEEAN